MNTDIENLVTSQNTERQSFIWNALNSMLIAGQSAILLLFISRLFDIKYSGYVSVGFAIANMFCNLGKYGVRNFQVTDLNEEYQFADYRYNRIITVIGSLFLSLVFIVGSSYVSHYSIDKFIIVIEITLYKMIEAYEDVYIGRLQQLSRLDIGSKLSFIRILISTLIMIAGIILFRDLIISIGMGVVSCILIEVAVIFFIRKVISYNKNQTNISNVRAIIKKCFPLALGMFLYMFVGNAPKYLVDIYLDEGQQAVIGYLMLPMFIILVLNNFLMQPMIRSIAEIMEKDDAKTINNMILKHVLVITALFMVVLLGSLFLAIPILSLLYKIELNNYRIVFVLLMVGSFAYTLSYYFSVLLTSLRNQGTIAYGYLIGLIVMAVLAIIVGFNDNLIKISITYILSNLCVMLFFYYCVRHAINIKG